jgi:hypothetical protein
MQINKILAGIFIGLAIATVSAAAKSYIDVERLKVKVTTLFDYVKETRDDVKYIKRQFHRRNDE